MALVLDSVEMNIGTEQWQSILASRLMLRPTVSSHKISYRGRLWCVLVDSISGRHFRCTDLVASFLHRLDGHITVGEALVSVNFFEHAHLSQSTPQQQASILRVLSILDTSDMLRNEIPKQSALSDPTQRKGKRRALPNPLAIRFSIWDPDRWIKKVLPSLSFILNKTGLYLNVFVILLGALLTFSVWEGLSLYFSVVFMNPANLLLIWLLYPIIKLLHELGHALLVKKWGGEVHDMGILFFVFIPIPYVDATSSYRFPKKTQRMLVAAAGILVELGLAAFGVIAWCILEDSLLREIAFNVAVIAGLSTLVINGNPLLRFDGYYFLSEWIEIPNLSQRSIQFLGRVSRRLLLGVDAPTIPEPDRGERYWFAVYGMLSGAYRWLIGIGIALYIGSHYFFVGVLLGSWYVMQFMLLPIWRAFSRLVQDAIRYKKAIRLFICAVSLAGVSFAFLFLIPMQSHMYVGGSVQIPELSFVRRPPDF